MTGYTLVITDDGNFKNLYHDSGSVGFVGDIKIMVVNELPNDIQELTDEYQNVVYVLSDMAEIEADCILQCHGDNRSLKAAGSKASEKKKESRAIDIYLRLRPIKTKDYQIILKPSYYRYLIETEERKELLILKDKVICTILSKNCSAAVGMKESQFYMLLLKDKYEISSKRN